METPFAHMISREIRKSRAADMQLRLFQYLFCDGCDSVDSYIKCRCRTIFGFMEISVRNIFCSIFLICIQFFAVYSKCRSIKYMKGTIADRIFYFFYFFFCALSLRGVILSAPSAKPLHQSVSIAVPSSMHCTA